MIYCYECQSCGHAFESVKSVRDIDSTEICDSCGSSSTRRVIARNFYFHGTDEKTEYYHAFGQYVTSRKQRRELMKKYNVEEIGNEDVESIHKRNEADIEARCERRWAEV